MNLWLIEKRLIIIGYEASSEIHMKTVRKKRQDGHGTIVY
jgi:hypothetical protein